MRLLLFIIQNIMGMVYKKISYDKVFHEICFDHLDDLVEEIDFSYWMCTGLEKNKRRVVIFEFENKEQSKTVLQSIEKLLYKVFIESSKKVVFFKSNFKNLFAWVYKSKDCKRSEAYLVYCGCDYSWNHVSDKCKLSNMFL